MDKWLYSKERIEKFTRGELAELALQNSMRSSYTFCPNCKVMKETDIKCWNCNYAGESWTEGDV